MSELLPLETLTRDAGIRPCFELAAPNPVLGKTAFLRLPLDDDWKYEVVPAAMQVKRNLILRDGVVVRDEPTANRSIAADELAKLRDAETAAKLIPLRDRN